MTAGVAKRYARALARVAEDEGRVAQIGEELDRVGEWLADPDFAAALASPALDASARHGLVGRLAESLGLSALARNFLALLADHNRLDHFAAIARAYQGLVDQSLDRVRAILRSATPLPDSTTSKIAGALEQISGKTVVLTTEIDRSLIAGVTVEIEGRVYDGSARTQLAHLAKSMSREGSRR
jgi:F-type H+-transporting ATPase subunit delta